MDFKTHIIKVLKKKKIECESLEVPPDPKMGDFAFPCFPLAKAHKKSPAEIAKDLEKKIKPDEFISKVKATGPYLNFFVNNSRLVPEVLKKIDLDFGKQKNKKTIMIESPSPNTNKPLHLGHVRNIVLGNSIISLYEHIGYRAIRTDVVNDRGVHICKSMLAYKRYGNNELPVEKTDHFVGRYYVKYANEVKKHPELEEQTQEMLKKWEDGDPETRELWMKMRKWALDGFAQTYERYGVRMDHPYYESEVFTKGKQIVENGLKNKIFKKDDKGNIVVDLEKKKLGTKVLLRANGTSVYMTQDTYLAKQRFDDYSMDKMVYIVGNEQKYHFQVLFEVFRLLKYKFADSCYHLAYGMIELPEGKMKSREGKVVDADDLAEEMKEMAKEEILKREPDIDKVELDDRAEQIAMASVKFFILKYDPMKDFVYDPKESLSFEGETGPYVQYTHARICSILRKTKLVKADTKLLALPEEANLVKMLADFPETIEKAAMQYKPHTLCRYLLDLSQMFNEYYHKERIIQDDKKLEAARLLLISKVKIVLEIGLGLLGIDALEKM